LLAFVAVALVVGLWLASREVWRTRQGRTEAASPAGVTEQAEETPATPPGSEEEEEKGPGEEGEGTRYRVTVVSRRDGSPIAGAKVLDNEDRCLGVTGTEGVTEFRAATKWMYAAAQGYFPINVDLDEKGNGWTALPPAVSVAGRIFDARTGKAVPNAEVELWAEDDGLGRDDAKSGEDGRYEVVGALWQGFRLTVEAPGYCPAERLGTIAGPLHDLDVGLVVGATLLGHVLDEQGLPMVKAGVFVTEGVERTSRGSAKTDDQGAFRIDDLPVGVELVPWISDPRRACAPVTFTAAGEVREVDLRVPASATLTVTARDGDGKPVEINGMRLERGEDTISSTRFDTGQGFVAPPGVYVLRVHPYGWPEQRREVMLSSGPQHLEMTFSGGLAIEGTILSADGSAISCGSVDWSSGQQYGFARADDAGHFRIDGLPKEPVRLTAEAWKFAAVVREGVVPGGPPVQIVLPVAGRIIGRLVGFGERDDVLTDIWCKTYSTSCFGVDEDGRFEYVIDRVGEPVLVVFRRREHEAPVVLALPPLGAGEVRDLGEVRFGPGREVRGTVLGADGKPLLGALVQVAEPWMDASGFQILTRSDEAGRFCLFRMPEGPFHVLVDAKGYPPYTFTVDGPAELRLTEGGAAEGPGSARLFPVSIHEWAYVAQVEAEPDERGFFHVRLQAGEYRGWSEDKATGTTREIVPFTVVEGKTTRVELKPR